MSRPFQFKQFTITQQASAHKVGTDGVLLGAWVNSTEAQSVLDIGTGTGVIALMLAQRSNAQISAIEPQAASFAEAEKNAAASPWANRVSVYQQTLQRFASTSQSTFDLIVSNPPFFVDSTKSGSSGRDQARHTDQLPFDALATCTRKLGHATSRLALVLPVEEAEQFANIAQPIGWHLARKTVVIPAPGKPPKRWLMEFIGQPSTVNDTSLQVEDAPRQYTEAYRKLTSAFYLNF